MTFPYCQHFFLKNFIFFKIFLKKSKKAHNTGFLYFRKITSLQFYFFIRYGKNLWLNNSYSGENYSIDFRTFYL